jgi:hypothetical protein
MFSWNDLQAQERDEELRRYVERHRQVDEAMAARWKPTLARLGRWLEAQGRALQEQYEVEVEAIMPDAPARQTPEGNPC